MRDEAQVPLGDLIADPGGGGFAPVGRLVVAHGVFPDAAPDGEADERVHLAGHLEPVVEPFRGRVPAQDDQVGPAAAGPGLRGHLLRRLDGLQALDLPQRGLDAVRLVVRDHRGYQAGTDVAVVGGSVTAGRLELRTGGRDEQLVEQRHPGSAQPGADLRQAAELRLPVGRVESGIVADQHLGVIGSDGLDVLQPLIAPFQGEPVVPAGLDGHRQH